MPFPIKVEGSIPSILTAPLTIAPCIAVDTVLGMTELSDFVRGLSYLGAVLRGKDGPMIVALPRPAWERLYYQVSMQMQEHSVHIGHGGIVAQYPPPDGETYANGFWFQGHWVKAKAAQ
jgi:hypothetical protein